MAEYAEYHSRKKSLPVALLLWLLFGGVGAHRFYLEDGKAIFFMLGFAAVFISAFAAPQATPILAIIYAGAIFIDLFWVFSGVEKFNQTLVNGISQEQALAEAKNNPVKSCPDCAEKVKAAAKKCRFCGFEFPAEDIKSIPKKQIKIQDINESIMDGKKLDKIEREFSNRKWPD
ncbi:zinc ribbon domain-containing protein [Kiloniella antarctica]|uniref:Zinc ribbon domain-containing protein n=1 Tax=Kiloniella antarctica TaxID=1550907 RepID=A0ABW5BKD2_9PROT